MPGRVVGAVAVVMPAVVVVPVPGLPRGVVGAVALVLLGVVGAVAHVACGVVRAVLRLGAARDRERAGDQ